MILFIIHLCAIISYHPDRTLSHTSLHRNSGLVILRFDRATTHEEGSVPKNIGIEKTGFPLSRE